MQPAKALLPIEVTEAGVVIDASFEQFSTTLLDSDLVAGVIRFGDGLMQLLTGMTKIKALLPVIVAGFMSWKNVGKLNSPNMPAYAQLQLVA